MVWTLVSFLAGCGASGPGLDRPGLLAVGAGAKFFKLLRCQSLVRACSACGAGMATPLWGPSDDGAPARVWCTAG